MADPKHLNHRLVFIFNFLNHKIEKAMRKLTLFVVAILAANMSFAQKGLEIGLEFTPCVTFVLNDQDFAEGEDLNFQGTFGFNTGLSLGYNFSDGIGISSGVLYSKQGQNYITDYNGLAKGDQDDFSRKLSYIRVPLLIKFNGDPTASSSSYFRIGPHFDFLQSARFVYDDKSTFNADYDLRLHKDAPYSTMDLYKKFVFGLTLEFGGSANINEYLKLTFMLHMSGNLNSENIGTAQLSNWNPLTGGIGFDAIPGYPADNISNAPYRERAGAFNVMGGINVGFRYNILMD